jgi:hypothetical protein
MVEEVQGGTPELGIGVGATCISRAFDSWMEPTARY